jgi:hypothetical protein
MYLTLPLLLLSAASALDITGRIVLPLPSVRSPSSAAASSGLSFPQEDAHTLRAVLDGGVATALVSPVDGTFSFPGVGAGLHSVEVFHADFLFPRFTVSVEGGEAVVAEYRYPGAPRLAGRLPLEVAPVAQAPHWEERPPSQVWAMLRSPMVLLGLVMLGLMACVGAPARCAHTPQHAHAHRAPPRRLTKNMVDPEEMKKIQEEQAAVRLQRPQPPQQNPAAFQNRTFLTQTLRPLNPYKPGDVRGSAGGAFRRRRRPRAREAARARKGGGAEKVGPPPPP